MHLLQKGGMVRLLVDVLDSSVKEPNYYGDEQGSDQYNKNEGKVFFQHSTSRNQIFQCNQIMIPPKRFTNFWSDNKATRGGQKSDSTC